MRETAGLSPEAFQSASSCEAFWNGARPVDQTHKRKQTNKHTIPGPFPDAFRSLAACEAFWNGARPVEKLAVALLLLNADLERCADPNLHTII